MSLVWGVLRSMFFVSIGGGILLFLAGAGIHPDRWVAAMLNVATTPDALTALFFVLAGVVGLALIVLWDAFDVQGRIRAHVQGRNSLDNTIEFEWGHSPSNSIVPADGKYFELTIAPIPVETLSGGPATISTAPGSPISSLGNLYLCKVTNHGPLPIFNALLVLQSVFWESVDDAKPEATLIAATPVKVKGQGKELISRPWNIRIPKVEADPAKPFVFYLSSPNDCFVSVTAPESISFQRLMRKDVETARLIPPHRLTLIIPPPMDLGLQPLPAEEPSHIAEHYPNIRIAESSEALSLFQGNERAKLIGLLQADKLTSWARPMGPGEPDLIRLGAERWSTHTLESHPKGREGMINQTFFRKKGSVGTAEFYDVYLNKVQLRSVWPGKEF